MTRILILVALIVPLSAHAEQPRPWRLGLGGNVLWNPSAPHEGASAGLGVVLRGVYALGRTYSVGLLFENTWLSPHDQSPELGARQQDVVVLNRFLLTSAPADVSLELGAGVARYSARVDIPETMDCFGCGRYGDTTYQPTVQLGAVTAFPVGGAFSFQAGARLVATPTLGQVTDRHNFLPAPLSVRLDAGLEARF